MGQRNIRETVAGALASRLAATVGVVLCAVVPVLGLTVLAPGLFASVRGAEATSSGSEVATAWRMLPFDAPTTSLRNLKGAGAVQQNAAEANEEPTEEVVLSDWRFTAHRHSTMSGGNGFTGFLQIFELLLEQELVQLTAFEQQIATFETLLLTILQDLLGTTSPHR